MKRSSCPCGVLCAALLITTGCQQTHKDVPEKTIDVDAGGHNLHMLIVGESGPTVVLESGFGGGIGWEQVRQEVGRFARVVTYDRGGFGASERGPKPRTARQIAVELRTALGNAGLSPPYILVGHSLGGPYVRVFAATYPDEVAGLVLVDPLHIKTYESMEEIQSWFNEHCRQDWDTVNAYCHQVPEEMSAMAWVRGLEQKHMAQFLETVSEPKRSSLRREWLAILAANPQPRPTVNPAASLYDEAAACAETFKQANADTLPNIPIILLAAPGRISPLYAAKNMLDPELRTLQKVEERRHLDDYRQWVDANPGVKLVVAYKCGHNIQLDNPALVIAAIQEVADPLLSSRKARR